MGEQRALRSTRLRNALWLAAGGRCQNCGEVLGDGWHADHKTPWALSHETNVHDMQALCGPCNLRKGARMQDGPDYRPFQAEMIQAARDKAAQGEKLLVVDGGAGSGKTIGYLATANDRIRETTARYLAVFAPRTNLTDQVETDWARIRDQFRLPRMGTIRSADNSLPFLREGCSGYAATYQALVAQPQAHIDFFRANPTILVGDEAQILGSSGDQQGTSAARYFLKLSELSPLTILVSGTPYRADGQRLILASYREEPRKGGGTHLVLNADVRATYLDGVAQGYLRPFEAILHNGIGRWQSLGEDPEELRLSEMDSQLYRVLQQDGYWQPLVDRFCVKVREVKTDIDRRLCGLISAYSQKHAEQIVKYLHRTHRDLSVLLAVSDEPGSRSNLERFRRGEADVLVTVAMAHVGYDHKPISVILPLTGARTYAFLDQLFARGFRMMADIPKELQICYAVVPDDRAMAAFVEAKRAESEQGLIERAKRESESGGGGGPNQAPLGIGLGALVTGVRAQGLNPEGDLTTDLYPIVEDIRRQHGSAESATRLFAMFRDLAPVLSAGHTVTVAPPPEPIVKTTREREKELRNLYHKLAGRHDKMQGWDPGTTNKYAVRQFSKGSPECSESELEERIRWVQGLLTEAATYAKDD